MKKITIILLAYMLLQPSTSLILAHGRRFGEMKTVGEHQVGFQITGDAPILVEDFPLAYEFRLLDKDGMEDVPYESAYIIVAKKTKELLVQAETLGPKDFAPGAIIDIAIQEPGDYTAEVIFVRGGASDGEPEVQAEFDFSIQASATSKQEEVASATEQDEEKGSSGLPGYVWALIVLIAGVIIGRVSKGGKKYS